MPKMLPVNMSVEGVHVAGRLAVESPDAGRAIGRRAGQLDAGITASVSAPRRILASRSGMWREAFSTTR